MSWPGSWQRLAEGGLYQGDFTQSGISYERVALVLANVPLGGCPSPVASAAPAAVPSDDPVVIPREAPDPRLACLKAAPLPAGSIRVVVEVGERSRGLVEASGPAIPDTSEPTPESGWTETVDGQPARLTVLGPLDVPAPGAAETRVWDVIFPTTIDHVLRIRADIGGPDLAAGRAAVASIVASIDFATDAAQLDAATAGTALRRLIDQLDRSARESRSDFYACFPREPGVVAGTISAGPGERLASAVDVTCETRIGASRLGMWRVTLTTRWKAGAGYPAGGLRQELFVEADGGLIGGGYLTSLDGDGTQLAEAQPRLPQAPRTLPDPVDGSPAVAPGTFVELLWPGIYPADVPGDPGALSTSSPGVVGWRLAVSGQPRTIGGVAWYPVQWEDQWRTSTRWLPATVDGRPAFTPVELRCPAGAPTLDGLLWLTAAERLACFGNDELTLAPLIASAVDAGGPVCTTAELELASCPPVDPADWLTAAPLFLLFDHRGAEGPLPGLAGWVEPSAGTAMPTGTWLEVHGHFDDARAADCRAAGELGGTDAEAARTAAVLDCRVRFVVTAFSPVAAP
jgi:hypothetical protein